MGHKEYGKHSEKAAHVTTFSHNFEEMAEENHLTRFNGVHAKTK